MWTDWAVAAMTSTANGKTSQTGHGSRNWCAPPCDIAMAATGTARSSWIGSLRRAGMPSEPTRSLLRSSAKPMTPPATSPATAGHAPECPASAASNPPTRPRIPKRMPPPVGVPAFFWWLSGSSVWITCACFSRRSRRMVGGYRTNAITNAATNVMTSRGTAGFLGERFGDQVAQMLGAAEHRSERIRVCASEDQRPQQRRWAAWAPKIRRGHPAGPLRSLGQLFHDLIQSRAVRCLDQNAVAATGAVLDPGHGSFFVGHEVSVRSVGEHAAQLAVENCDGVEPLGGLAADAPVRLDGQRTELAHGTEHREQPALTRPLSQSFKRGQHRLGAGVVSVVDDHDAV